MNLLAIDTSSAATIVTAAAGDDVAVRFHRPQGRERPRHTSASLVLAEEALTELGLTWGDLDRIGAGTGPGSFTGLRSGIAAAAGLARAGGIWLVPVTATRQWAQAAGALRGASDPLLVAVDGRRGELFIERFSNGLTGAGIERHRRDSLTALGDLAGVTVVGDGAALEADVFVALGGRVAGFGGHDADLLRGRALAALTAAGEPEHPDAVLPVYGRQPDAVPSAERTR